MGWEGAECFIFEHSLQSLPGQYLTFQSFIKLVQPGENNMLEDCYLILTVTFSVHSPQQRAGYPALQHIIRYFHHILHHFQIFSDYFHF